MVCQNRKIVLIFDNCAAHSQFMLSNIQLFCYHQLLAQELSILLKLATGSWFGSCYNAVQWSHFWPICMYPCESGINFNHTAKISYWIEIAWNDVNSSTNSAELVQCEIPVVQSVFMNTDQENYLQNTDDMMLLFSGMMLCQNARFGKSKFGSNYRF